jgi:hypothetical protein
MCYQRICTTKEKIMAKKIKLELTEAQFLAVIDLADTVEAMTGCGEELNCCVCSKEIDLDHGDKDDTICIDCFNDMTAD